MKKVRFRRLQTSEINIRDIGSILSFRIPMPSFVQACMPGHLYVHLLCLAWCCAFRCAPPFFGLIVYILLFLSWFIIILFLSFYFYF